MAYDKTKDPAWRLFNSYYHCLVPEYLLADLEENRYGYRRAGYDDEDDAILSQQKRRVRIPILTNEDRRTHPCIAEIVAQGVQMVLVNPTDAVKIFDNIREHLQSWQKALAEEVTLPGNQEDVEMVMDDLVKLDNLQMHIHTLAMRYIEGPVESMLARKMSTKRRRGIGRGSEVEHEPNKEVQAYSPVKLHLKKEILNRRRYGWS